jgi:hyperosmotically inducible protein
MKRVREILVVGALLLGASIVPSPASAQLSDILLAPKTLIDRAIEARSAKDIATDNRIVVDVNAIMVEYTTIKASTEIYEQRLLVTGIFDDLKLFDDFSAKVRKVEGVKELYWHVIYMSEEDQEKRKAELLDWPDAVVLNTKAGLSLIGTRGVADVNFRTAVDSFSTTYLLGRARSQPELDKALAAVKETEGVAKVVNYAVVRP